MLVILERSESVRILIKRLGSLNCFIIAEEGVTPWIESYILAAGG